MCVPSAQEPEGGEGHRMRPLRLQGLCKWGLIDFIFPLHAGDAKLPCTIFIIELDYVQVLVLPFGEA